MNLIRSYAFTLWWVAYSISWANASSRDGTRLSSDAACDIKRFLSLVRNRELLELTPCDTVLLQIPQEDVDAEFNDLVDRLAPDINIPYSGITISAAQAVKFLFTGKKNFGVQVRKVCASCEQVLSADPRHAVEYNTPAFEKYCGDSVYGNDIVHSGLVTIPLLANEEIRSGALSSYVYSRPTTASKGGVPSGTVDSFDEDVNTAFGIIATIANGLVSFSPDFMGYGSSNALRSYIIKDAYVAATVPLILKAQTFLREQTNCETDLAKSSFYLGYSEGGYASVSLANGLKEVFGWEPLFVEAGGGPYRLKDKLLYEVVKTEDALVDNNRDEKYYSALIGAAYSSTNPDVANYQKGQDLLKPEIRDEVVGWLAEPDITQNELNDRIDAQVNGGTLDDIWNPDFLTLVRGAIAAGNTEYCQPSYSGYEVGKHDKLCEALIQNDLLDILVNADYPIQFCHSENDEIVTFENVPDLNLNPEYLSLVKKTSAHSEAGFECLIEAVVFLSDDIDDLIPEVPSLPGGGCPSVTFSPTATPLEDADNFFLLKKDGTTEKCGFLSTQTGAKRAKICGESRKYQIRSNANRLAPASVACPDSCAGICVKEINRNKFLFRTTKKGTKEKRKTCKWLQKQDPAKIAKICAKTVSLKGDAAPSIYGQASEVCTTTCTTCPPSSSITV